MKYRLGNDFIGLLHKMAEMNNISVTVPHDSHICGKMNPLLSSLVFLYSESIRREKPISIDKCRGLHKILLFEKELNSQIREIESSVREPGLLPSSLFTPLTYFIDELVCNMQQHAGTNKGYIYLNIDEGEPVLEVCIADLGISIYGSYVRAQKYLEYISDSPAEALSLAKDGFSTKNRPEAENRGYGISTNSRMVVEGFYDYIA